jgi:hypothetical protein
MKCPHCLISFHDGEEYMSIGKDCESFWAVRHQNCPSCGKKIIRLIEYFPEYSMLKQEVLVYPKGFSRTPLSKDIPSKFAQDYKESCLVINDSPKASAALSRRCLQNIIREMAGIKKSDLNQEIQALLDTKSLSTSLANSVDAIRVLGNFAAHPIKSTNTGEIVDVESGEADWLLDVLEELFDYYFVQPAELKRKRDKLNKKLKDVGKPPIK